jgi:hypothetical protein
MMPHARDTVAGPGSDGSRSRAPGARQASTMSMATMAAGMATALTTTSAANT